MFKPAMYISHLPRGGSRVQFVTAVMAFYPPDQKGVKRLSASSHDAGDLTFSGLPSLVMRSLARRN